LRNNSQAGHDVLQSLYRYAAFMLPFDVLEQKCDVYIAEGLLTGPQKEEFIAVVRRQRQTGAGDESGGEALWAVAARWSAAEMQTELDGMVAAMRTWDGKVDIDTDQWEVYNYVTEVLSGRRPGPLRLCVQAGAGSGKSFALIAILLWCVVHGFPAECVAPTGIAATRIALPAAGIRGITLHVLAALNAALECRANPNNPKDDRLTPMREARMVAADEMSMVDVETGEAFMDQLQRTATDANSGAHVKDDFGGRHMLMILDVAQLPPATDGAPFVVSRHVRDRFKWMTMTQNRRLAASRSPQHRPVASKCGGVHVWGLLLLTCP
jgi:hypothetical protein